MDMELVINTLESQNLLRTKKKVGDYMTCYCPFHNNGNEKKPSCGILLTEQFKGGTHYPEGFWHCFSCGYANQLEQGITDILSNHGLSGTGEEWLSANIPDYSATDKESESLIPPSLITAISNQYAIDYIDEKQGVSPKYVSEKELASYRYTVPYMYERKLTDEIIEKFDVGFDANFRPYGKTSKPIPSLTFPVRDERGNTLFIYRRSIENRFHNYPKEVLKPVYGLDQIPTGYQGPVYVCESIINALTLWTYGYVAVALMGTGNSYQISQLRKLGVHDFVLCMDGDESGARGSEKLYRRLSDIAMVWRIDMIEGEDVNSIDRETFEKLNADRY